MRFDLWFEFEDEVISCCVEVGVWFCEFEERFWLWVCLKFRLGFERSLQLGFELFWFCLLYTSPSPRD